MSDHGLDAVLGEDATGATFGLICLKRDGLEVGLTNYGARMLSIRAPDRAGRLDHVLLGFERGDMILKSGSFGAVLGRFANRIAGGRFELDGRIWQLSKNDGNNTLHGGKLAFAKKVWTIAHRADATVTFALVSPDGDQGFPGELQVAATYRLEPGCLSLELSATTDRATPVNLSAHPYFNLGGVEALDVCDHLLEVDAARFLPTDAEQIPTGALQSVDATPFDFRRPVVLGTRIRGSDPQLLVARGFDHCLLIDGPPGTLRRACRLTHPASGRVLTIESDRDGLQVYTGNSLNGSMVGFGGTYRMTAGLALEAQSYPDAPNHPNFPSTILQPGETFRATIRYVFSTVD